MSVIPPGVSSNFRFRGGRTLDFLANTLAPEEVAKRGKRLQKGICDILEVHSIPFVISGHPSMFGAQFAETQPKDLRDWTASALVKRGTMSEPASLESWFFRRGHGFQYIDETLTAEVSVKEMLANS